MIAIFNFKFTYIIHYIVAPIFITSNSTSIRVKPGNTVHLLVNISNAFPSDTQWLMNSTAIMNLPFASNTETYQNDTKTTTSILQLHSVFLNNSGIYSIIANNSINSSSLNFSINIYGK